MFTLIYVIGFVISVVLAILWERNGPPDPPWSAYEIVTISVLWPVSVPLIAFLFALELVDALAHPTTYGSPAMQGECSRCHAKLRRPAKFCAWCGQERLSGQGK